MTLVAVFDSEACWLATLGPETLASEVDWRVALAFEFWRWLEEPACPAWWSVAGADGCCWVAFADQLLASIVDFFGLFQGLMTGMGNDSNSIP